MDRKDKVQMNSEDRFTVNKINKRKKRDQRLEYNRFKQKGSMKQLKSIANHLDASSNKI